MTTATIEKNYIMYGTKIINHETNEIGLLLYTRTNKYADGDVSFAACVDLDGKKYNIKTDNITPAEEWIARLK